MTNDHHPKTAPNARASDQNNAPNESDFLRELCNNNAMH